MSKNQDLKVWTVSWVEGNLDGDGWVHGYHDCLSSTYLLDLYIVPYSACRMRLFGYVFILLVEPLLLLQDRIP